MGLEPGDSACALRIRRSPPAPLEHKSAAPGNIACPMNEGASVHGAFRFLGDRRDSSLPLGHMPMLLPRIGEGVGMGYCRFPLASTTTTWSSMPSSHASTVPS